MKDLKKLVEDLSNKIEGFGTQLNTSLNDLGSRNILGGGQ